MTASGCFPSDSCTIRTPALAPTRVAPAAWLRLQHTPGVVKSDRSALAETFKMLRNQVLQRMRVNGHRLLAVTSPRPIGGKSLTALNLALDGGEPFPQERISARRHGQLHRGCDQGAVQCLP